MKSKLLSYLLGILLVSSNIFAQPDSITGPEILTRPPLGITIRPFLEYRNMTSVESNNLSTDILARLISSNINDQALIDEISSSLDNGLKIGSLQNNEIRFTFKGHKKRYLRPYAKQSIAIFQRAQTALSASEDLVNLILNGNKATAGTAQDLSDFSYEEWLYSGLQLQFAFLIDTVPVSVGASLIVGHKHQSANTNNTTLFTAENGTEIRFDGSFNYNSVGRPFLYGIAGVGLGIDLATEERWGKHQVKLAAQDLGFITFVDGTNLALDSSFSFTGINVSNIFALQESIFEASLDSTANVFGEPRTINYTRLLPFMLQLEYEYHISKSNLKSLYLQGRYRYLMSYLPRVELGARWQITENIRLNTAINLGGFNSWGLSTEYYWQIRKLWQLGLGVSHVNTLVVQSLAGGSSAFISLRYYL